MCTRCLGFAGLVDNLGGRIRTAHQRCLAKPAPHFLLSGICGADTGYLHHVLGQFSIGANHLGERIDVEMTRSTDYVAACDRSNSSVVTVRIWRSHRQLLKRGVDSV